ncbi:GNAT family N-acetyltransferase [uncultured Erythrobacter sp.]|uniref:GNAT family N-acetyltransferase n=1 Tax=uncultured Erythrobacter sp. TaxID=263913 RepID=UPI00262AF9A5|nr:GNAT family N-acetyltransferase [uncultured Erythrobacter sp.]
MAYAIRPFRTEDAASLADLTLAAIRTVGSQSYSSEQVDAWAARHPGPERFIERAGGGSHIFVAADDSDIPVAYSLLEPDGHLDMLYCHPKHTRRGLADQLLAVAEQTAITLKTESLYTEASELARPAFERAGYEVTQRRDFEIEGVAIHNYAMEKRLT